MKIKWITCFIYLIFSLNIFGNDDIDKKKCVDVNSCPKIIEIAFANFLNPLNNQSVDISFPLLIKNNSNKNIYTMIAASHENTQVNCGLFFVPSKKSTIGEISCNIPGLPYTLADRDGRSNTLQVGGSEACSGKSLGDSCQGGIIFQTDLATGLIVSEINNSNSIGWGCDGTAIGASAQSNTDGTTNTAAIVSGCSNSSFAAKICSDYSVTKNGITYSDWYLPAKDELNVLYLNRNLSNINLTTGIYWSSTEDSFGSSDFASRQDFSSGSQLFDSKSSNNKVRCIKKF